MSVKTRKLNLQVNCRPGDRAAINQISDEWRLNLYETVAALVKLWNNSTDEQRIAAIRQPTAQRQTVSA